MKQFFTLILLTLSVWSLSQAQITLPYTEDLEAEVNGSISCNATQTFTTLNWTNSTTDDLDWVIDDSGTGSTNTGPTANGGADHNPGASGGKYLYVETSSPCNTGGQDVALISDEVYTTGNEPNLYFDFWYHQFGADINYILVNIRTVTAGVAGSWVQQDSLYTAPPGVDGWQLSSNDLSSFIGDTFQIQIVGTTGNFGPNGWECDYALDDFSMYSLFADDAGISAIDGPFSPAPAGINNVAVSVTNYGNSNLTTAMINWEFNGVLQTPFSYTAPLTGLPTGGTEGGVVIGTGNVVPGIFSVKAWTTMPNGSPDSVAVNDTSMITGCGGALKGTYTVGGGAADFADLTSLGFVLSTCGIDSHTIININPGVYNERLILETVPGTSDTSTLTINGGDAATTTIRNGTFSNIYLNGTSYTTIKNLTLEVTGTIDNYGVQLRDSASFNTIDSCMIMMNDSATNMSDVVGVSASNTETSSFSELLNAYFTTVSNCTISGGEKGVHYEGDLGNGNRNVGNTCINNLFLNQEDYGIYVDEQDSLTIVGNTISGLRNVDADAIYLFDVMMFNVSGNTAYDVPDYGIAITDGNFETTPTSRGKVVNNMVHSLTDRGLWMDDINETDVFHNTITTSSTTANNGAFYTDDFVDVDVRNNIFYSENNYAWYSLESLAASGNVVDYNIYFSNGPSLIDAPAVYADLAAWQLAEPSLNANSVEMDPTFLGGLSDLHLFAPSDDDLGDNSVGVLVDIDGEVRPQGTNVDIGADEFTPVADDAGVSAIQNPISPAAVGLNNVEVAVTNYGADSLFTATIEWELNGVAQTPFAFVDSLESGDTRNNIIIGSTTVGGGVVFDIKAWTAMPNGVADLLPANDTSEVTGCGALRGVYTAGGVGADFVDMASLSFALSNCGIDSHTVININPGFYAENLNLVNVPGTADTVTLTINGGSAATTTISASSLAAIALDGTNYTTIKNLTLEASGATDAYGVHLTNAANFNTIDSCVIVLDDTTTNLNDIIGVSASSDILNDFAEGDNASHTTVSNCTITGGEYAIHFEAITATRSVGNRFINNTLINNEDYGIYCDDQDSIEVIGNTITGLRSTFADGIYIFDLELFDVSNNLVVDAPDYGIWIDDGNAAAPSTSRASVINNMVSSTTDRALYLNDVHETDVFHNTVAASISGTANGAFYVNDLQDVDVRNNIFFGDGGFAMYSLDDLITVGSNNFDYNCYFTTGPNLVDAGPNVHATLVDWQAAQATLNVNSVETDPIFVSNFDDLHVLGAGVNDVGDNTVGILVDIDGDVRPETPSTVVDMGADEFTPLTDDAEGVEVLEFDDVCGNALVDVRVLIRNLGVNPITSLPITVNYSGASSGVLNFTYAGSLAFGDYDTVTVGTINTTNGGAYSFDGFVVLTGDQQVLNDTFVPLNTTFAPAVPTGNDAYDCGTDSALLTANVFPGAAYNWYASNDPLDTVPVATGTSFMIPSLAAQDTYYLGYKPSTAGSLTTTFAGGNGCGGGNMFDIFANAELNINALDVASDLIVGSTVPVTVHYIPNGTFAGNETNAAAWTTLGTFSGIAAGIGLPTFIDFGGNDLVIPAGSQYAIYVEYAADYTNGTTTFSNADMDVFTGTGLCSSFGGPNAGRMFNGTIYYGTIACASARTPVAGISTPGVSVDLGNDTVLCGTSLDLDAGSMADFYDWSTSDTTQMITLTASGIYSVLVSDSLGCVANDTVDVIINTPPTVNVGSDIVQCGTDSIIVTASGTTPVNYAWSTSDTSQSIEVNATGTYSVVVTDSVGCEDTDTMTVTYLPDASFDTAVAGCGAYTWIDGNTYAIDTLVEYVIAGGAANGCDSVINLDLDVTIVDTGVTQANAVLTANANNAIYQWVDCNNGNAPIVNETGQSFTATANGSYAVEVTDDGCTQTSACFTVTGLSVRNFGDASLMNLFPNPTENVFTVDFGADMKDVELRILTVDGRVMQIHEDVDGQLFDLSLENYPAGMYFVEVSSKGTVTSLKVSKF